MGLFSKVKERFNKVKAEHDEREKELKLQHQVEEGAYKNELRKASRKEARQSGLKRARKEAKAKYSGKGRGVSLGNATNFLIGPEAEKRRGEAASSLFSSSSNAPTYTRRRGGKQKSEGDLFGLEGAENITGLNIGGGSSTRRKRNGEEWNPW